MSQRGWGLFKEIFDEKMNRHPPSFISLFEAALKRRATATEAEIK